MFQGYEFDPDGLEADIRSRGWTRVAIQSPEGLLASTLELVLYLKQRGLEACMLADPCYGACDLAPVPEGFHGVVHIGHSPMKGQNALFVELFSRADNIAVLETLELPQVIGLAATVQHIRLLESARDILESRGKSVVVGMPKETSRTEHPGQILGCDLSAVRTTSAEAYVLLSSGVFHARGLGAATGKPVHVVDPHTGTANHIDGEALLRRRHAVMESARDCNVFGVVVSTKPGQRRSILGESLIRELENRNRKGVLLFMDNLNPDVFRGLGVDAVVSTACPRIALDDNLSYPVPVLTPVELRILLGLEPWESYKMDEILYNGEENEVP